MNRTTDERYRITIQLEVADDEGDWHIERNERIFEAFCSITEAQAMARRIEQHARLDVNAALRRR